MWVYAAATTNVEYTLQVTDVFTGETATYFNPLGEAAPAVTDTKALSCDGANAAPSDRTPHYRGPPHLQTNRPASNRSVLPRRPIPGPVPPTNRRSASQEESSS